MSALLEAQSLVVRRQLIQQDIIDSDFPHLSGSTMPFIVRTSAHERDGYTPWEMPLNLKLFHWSALWNNLRKRVPDEIYHRGYEVVNAKAKGAESVTLQFEDGSEANFDLVSGIRSTSPPPTQPRPPPGGNKPLLFQRNLPMLPTKSRLLWVGGFETVRAFSDCLTSRVFEPAA